MNKNLVWVLCAVMVCFNFWSCKEEIVGLDDSKMKKDFTLVSVSPIEISNDPIPIYSIGKVASEEEIKLSFKVGGIISEIRAKEGMSVRKGAILARLRTTEIDAQVSKAQRALQKAERDLERVNKMYKEGAATLENIQDLNTLVEVSRADLKVAEFNQNYAKIESPVFGRVLVKNAEANELVGPGQPIFIISSRQSSSLLKASISDKDIPKINYGDPANIYFDAFPNETFKGNVLRISESADPRTGTFELEIELDERGNRLRNGYIGRVEILPKQVNSYLKVPMGALVEGIDDSVVIFSANDSIAQKHVVIPQYIGKDYFTIARDSDIEIKNVITSGAPYLLDGDKIKISQSRIQ